MTTPPQRGRSRPDLTVGREPGFDMGAAFDAMEGSIGALSTTMAQVGRDITSALDMSARFGTAGAGGAGSTPAQAAFRASRLNPTTRLQQVAKAHGFGLQGDPTAGQTRLSTMQALSSHEGAAGAAAQWLGERIAGEPLYDRIPAGQTTTSTLGAPGAPPGAAEGGGAGAGWLGESPAWPGGGGGGGQGGAGGGMTPAPQAGRAAPSGGGPGIGLRTTLGARMAASGGTASGIMRAIRDVPGLALLEKGFNVVQNQRERNRQFQEVEGGSNLGGMQERGHQLGYQLSMMGVMSPSDSAAAFQGVTQLGYNRANVSNGQPGQNRQDALNFVYHNYMDRGMDVEDSLKLLETASTNANVSLQGLSDSLKSVSDTAGKAGVNAETMRQQFSQVFAAAITAGAGGGAPQIAGAIATQQASYGRSFQDTNFAGETSQAQQYMLSGKYGITPGAVQYLMQQQPQAYNKMLSGNNNQIIGSLLTGSQLSQMSGMIGQYGGAGSLDPQKTQAIASQFMAQNYNSLNPDVMAQVINAQTGLNLNANNVLQWVVNQRAGNNEASAGAGLGRSGAAVSANRIGGAPLGLHGLAQPTGIQNPTMSRFGGATPPLDWENVLMQAQGGKGNNRAAAAYLSQESASGKRSPVLEAILQNVPAGGQVSVNTRSGMRVMSLSAAMKYYPNELASGGAVFRNGNVAGESVSQVTQGLVDRGVSTAEELRQVAGSGQGVTQAAYNKAHPSRGSEPGKPVVVTLSSEARQLLKLLPDNSAASQGGVPVNPYASSASR